MGFERRYKKRREDLLQDKVICEENRELFRQFFEFEEYKLKRKNGLRELDEGCYKTLCLYVIRLRNANAWFGNKPWKLLEKEDIKKVYDDLEDGRIKNQRGVAFQDRKSYYNKIFKSKPFALAGKDQIARDVIEYYTESAKEVRFVDEENFKKIVSVVSNPLHLFLLWLAWDIGENINTLLQLKKQDFVRQFSGDQQAEYLVNLPKEKLKRSRVSRSEPTLYNDTVKYGDIALPALSQDDLVFNFGYRQALKFLKAAVKRSNAFCLPKRDKVSWKDLRSGMACHLLRQGWTIDEINFRLGHKPSSKEIDVYVSYLAIDRQKPKRRLIDSAAEHVQDQLEESRSREKLAVARAKTQDEENQILRRELEQTKSDIGDLKEMITTLLHKSHTNILQK